MDSFAVPGLRQPSHYGGLKPSPFWQLNLQRQKQTIRKPTQIHFHSKRPQSSIKMNINIIYGLKF